MAGLLGISGACLWDLFGVKRGSCLTHTFGFLPSGSKRCETSVSHARCGREGCSMGASNGGDMADRQAVRSVPHPWPGSESRAGLTVGPEVSLSPFGIRRHVAVVQLRQGVPGRVGTFDTAPCSISSSQLWPRCGSWSEHRQPKLLEKERSHWPSRYPHSLPVSWLTSVRMWMQPPGSQPHLGAWTPPSATSKGPFGVPWLSEAILGLPLPLDALWLWGLPLATPLTLLQAQTQALPAHTISSCSVRLSIAVYSTCPLSQECAWFLVKTQNSTSKVFLLHVEVRQENELAEETWKRVRKRQGFQERKRLFYW